MSGKYQALLGLSKTIFFLQLREDLQSVNSTAGPQVLPWCHGRMRSSFDYGNHLLSPWQQEGWAWATCAWNFCCELLTLTILHTGTQQPRQPQVLIERGWLPGSLIIRRPCLPSLSTSLISGSKSLVLKSTFQWNWWLEMIYLRLLIPLGTLNKIWCSRWIYLGSHVCNCGLFVTGDIDTGK